MGYRALLHLHLLCVTLSGLGFVLRMILRLRGSPWLKKRITRTLPHIIDTVLLGAAVGLMYEIRQFPLVNSWLTLKLCLVLLYIFFGVVAFKERTPPRRRAFAFAAAIGCYLSAYVLGIYHPFLLPG